MNWINLIVTIVLIIAGTILNLIAYILREEIERDRKRWSYLIKKIIIML